MNEPGNPQGNKENKEITQPEAAITWGRRKKRNREKQQKIARREKRQKGKRNIKKRQKQIGYNPEWETLINLENGFRTLNIASLKPDSFKEQTTQQEITSELTKRKIHLATIQETRISEKSQL